MTTATTAYRDYILERFAGKMVASSTTIQRDFVIQADAEPCGFDRLPPILKEPESELDIFVRSQPTRVRQVKVRIVARTIGVPNPILPDLGE